MILSIMVPHFAVIGSEGMPPVPPTILMSAYTYPIVTFEAETGFIHFKTFIHLKLIVLHGLSQVFNSWPYGLLKKSYFKVHTHIWY
jgi:hypothetical protein